MTNQRGRKSADELAALARTESREVLQPPGDLTPEQAFIFNEILEDLPDGMISREQVPLVAQLSRHIVSANRLGAWIDRIENNPVRDFDGPEYMKTLESRRKETSAISSIMRALRLTNQSRYRPDSAKLDRPSSKEPWVF